jgi:hypothetical protein
MARYSDCTVAKLFVPAMAILSCACFCTEAFGAADVPVPGSCTPSVNQKLAELVAAGQQGDVDNVMVCGTTISPSRHQKARRNGPHEILPVLVPFPDGSKKLVEVVVNDDLDGRITAPAKASVLAFGQAFFSNTGQFVAGVHDVHCSTHRGADNGWVVVNGTKHPASCSQ